MVEFVEYASLAFEVAAVSVMVLGTLLALFRFLSVYRSHEAPYGVFRETFVRSLLLSLELLVAADIIDTVFIEKTLESLGALGLLVVIRTFLSFSLEVELTGRWPWQGGHEGTSEA